MFLISIKTAKIYLDLFEPELIKVDDCVFIKSFCKKNIPKDSDLIGKECFINHVHIFDLFNHQAKLNGENDIWYDTNHPDFKLAWQLACAIGFHWNFLLKKQFPQHNFRVYCTKYDNPIVRFHVVRKNETNWMSDSQNEECVIIYQSENL